MIQLRGLHPFLREAAEEAVRWARSHGVEPRITSVRRTWADQSQLYEKYLSCKARGLYPWAPGCRYPANPPGWSGHEYGLAWDSTVPEAYLGWWVAVREALGFLVPAGDEIHAEHPETQDYVRFVNEQRFG